MRKAIFSLFLLALSTSIVSGQQFDLVLEGGCVMDPETGVNAVRNVGIRDGKIVRISSEALNGRRLVHAGGLVVAPGFIDLHQHGQDVVEPTATVFLFDRLCPAADAAAHGVGGHRVGKGAMRNHPAEATEGRGTDPGDSAQGLDLTGGRLSSRRIVYACPRRSGDRRSGHIDLPRPHCDVSAE